MFKLGLRSLGLPCLFGFLFAGSAISATGSDSMGIWIDDSGQGAIEIKNCNGTLCGQVVWLKSAKYASRCSLSVIGGLSEIGDGTWGGGWIYDPQTKAKFDVEISPVGNGKLKVLGYAGTKSFSRTMTWTRAPDDLKRCDEARPAVETARTEPKKAPSPAPGARTRLVDAASAQASSDAASPNASTSKDDAVPKLSGGGDPVGPAKVVTRSTARGAAQRVAASERSAKRRPATVKLAELGAYGLQDITLRKARGGCSLKVSGFVNVGFPC